MADIPETKVLAIASHVAYGYVGNTMATFVMQYLGCEVSAINTVHYSNHTAYKQVKGRKTPAEEITELYTGLQQSLLNDYDVLLSGYIPSAEAVEAVGKIGRDLKFSNGMKAGSFFWVLDPVMGDAGHLYVNPSVLPAYKSLLRSADLLLPNEFEAELLSDVKITGLPSLARAIQVLHKEYQVPHIIITSVKFGGEEGLSVIGSSATSDWQPRLWKIHVPSYPVFFSGTGDMFAALTVARLREAVFEAGVQDVASWRSPDDIEAVDLPLAKAAEKVLASMQAILGKTYEHYQDNLKVIEEAESRSGPSDKEAEDGPTRAHLLKTKATEVRVVRNAKDLVDPPDLESYKAVAVDVDIKALGDERSADELGVVNLGGKGGDGAVHELNDKRWGPGPS
ncbi:Ribokinase-like protein [Venturia nashicola]|nr:Ribokinase-like protein [Venturia nashicola]